MNRCAVWDDAGPAGLSLWSAEEELITFSQIPQFDAAVGDFDGDGDDDFVEIWTSRPASGLALPVTLAVNTLRSDALWSHTTADVGLTLQPTEAFEIPSNVRVVAGQFDPTDAALELAVGYRAPAATQDARYRVEIWDFTPGPDGTLDAFFRFGTDGPASPETLFHSQRFDLAATDFDLDGTDEVVLAGIEQGSTSVMRRRFVQILACDDGALVQRVHSYELDEYDRHAPGDFNDESCDDCDGAGHYIDHVAVATGALDANTSVHSIVMVTGHRYGVWDRDYVGTWPFGSWKYDFYAKNDIFGVVLGVDTSQAPWGVNGWVTQRADTEGSWHRLRNDAGSRYFYQVTGPALGVDMGDLNADGIDEVVLASLGKTRVWVFPGIRWFSEYYASTSTVFDAGSYKWNDPSRRIIEVADLDASMSSTGSDWQPEIVAQDWGGTTNRSRIRTYRPASWPAENDLPTGWNLVASGEDPALAFDGALANQCGTALVCGDFDGDGFRLAPPKVRRALEIVEPLVVIKTPPVHFDVFEGVSYDVANCYPPAPAPRGYQCTDFYATYTQTETSNISFTQSIQDNIAASVTLTTTAQADLKLLKLKSESRIKTSVGLHLEREGRSSETTTVTQAMDTIDGHDRVLVSSMAYDVFEYPLVRGTGDHEQIFGYYLVTQPDPFGEELTWQVYEDYIGPGLPPMSEPGNILSYPSQIDPETDENIVELWDSATWNLAKRATPFDITLDYLRSLSRTEDWNAGLDVHGSVEAEADILKGIAKVGVKLEVDGSYSHREVTTRHMEVGGGIHVTANIGVLSVEEQWPYSVHPFMYRTPSGMIVLDYEVNPVDQATDNWWDIHYRDDADPAFVLPMRYDAEKRIGLTFPSSRFWTSDLRLSPSTAESGDIVTITAVVHNFSLAYLDDEVRVRFYVGDPDGGTWGDQVGGVQPYVGSIPIQGLGGEPHVSTVGGIPARGSQEVEMRWMVPGGIVENPWIFAVIETDGSQIHTNNDKGYARLIARGTVTDAGPPLVVRSSVLEQNVPNPFNPVTSISFALEKAGHTRLAVHDLTGRRIAVLVDEVLPSGLHVRTWNGTDDHGAPVGSGVYLYRIEADDYVQTRKLVIVK